MTYEAKLQEFWSSFEMGAYPSTTELDDVTFPYLVYEVVYPEPYESSAGVVNVYDYTSSEAKANAVARKIREFIGEDGKLLSYDDGHIWIKLGSPQQINLVNSTNNAIKQRQLNLIYEVHNK